MKRPALPRKSFGRAPWPLPATAALALALATLLAGPGGGARGASSIFDDDWKPPAGSARPVKPAEPPPPPPDAPTSAAPRLPPRAIPVARPPTPTPETPTPATPATPVPLARAPVPNAAAVAAAEKVIKEIFKAEYAGKSAAEQSAFARTLLSEAQQSRNDPAALYVLLRDARDLASASGDIEVAVEAARGLRDAFQIDARSARDMEQSAYAAAVRGLAVAPPALVSYAAAHRAVDMGMQIVEYDLSQDDYATAAQMAAQAAQVVGRVVDWEFPSRVRRRAGEVQAIDAEYELNKASIAALKTTPADPAANLAAGRFYAFFLDDPARGLPLLAKGSDATLKALAARDLAALPRGAAAPVAAADQQAALADAWADGAKALTGAPAVVHDAMQRRALFWYDSGSAALEGLTKAAVEKRANELRVSRAVHGLTGEYFRGQDFGRRMFVRTDPRMEVSWTGMRPEYSLAPDYFSVRWTGWVKGAPGRCKLMAVHDDGARVWIDGQPVFDKWEDGTHKESTEFQFTGAMQPLRIEYMQETSGSYMGLGWTLPKATKVKAVPNEAYFHDPIPPGPIYTEVPEPDREGQITLTAAAADIHGVARFAQSGDYPGAIMWWTELTTWVNWDFTAPEGEYTVDVTYACDGRDAGSEYVVSAGLNRLTGKAADTGGWRESNARTDSLGRVRLGTGLQSLRIKPKTKPGNGVMNLGQVVLTPVRKGG